MANSTQKNKVTIVTVTYGKRWEFLRQQISSLINHGNINNIVVVNNGSDPSFHDGIKQYLVNRKINLIDSNENKGSAWGFNVGIDKAIQLNDDYIFLLDDDNVPEGKCITNLLISAETHNGLFALCAYRPSIHRQTQALQGIEQILLKNNSFAGFDISEFFPRIYRKILERNKPNRQLNLECEMATAPYGGVFATTSTFREIGLPKADYFVYGDDTEYTFRLTKRGGKIWLRSDCVVEDVDQSWGTQANVHHYFILDAPLFRLEQTTRNIARFEAEQGFGGVRYSLNKYVFLGIHFLKAIKFYRRLNPVFNRYKAILNYTNEGKNLANTHYSARI